MAFNTLTTIGGTKVTNYNINTKMSPSLEWVPQISLGIKNWMTVSSSENNNVLIAGAKNDYFYVSNDSGNNWMQYAFRVCTWEAVCVSGNGNILIAGGTNVAESGGTYVDSTGATELYISRDSGNTFSSCFGARYWNSCCCSYDGIYIYACAVTAWIYVSKDSGNTWVARHTQQRWSGIGTSNDGSKVCACVYDNYIYVSLNYGDTWTTKLSTTNKLYRNVVVSPNGNYFFVTILELNNTYSYMISNNSGTSWGLRTDNYNPFSSSFTGNKLIGARYRNSYLTLSTNAGANWSNLVDIGYGNPWQTGSLSSDGTKLITAIHGGYVYLISGL
jgi:hypothetical protein